MRELWRGSWATRIRIGSGLVLMLYALLHFINIGLGLFGPGAMEVFQEARLIVTRSAVGTVVLYGALLAHASLALWRLACRGTLRMPVWEGVQLALGLIIPLALVDHIVFTRLGHEVFGINDDYGFLISLIFGTSDGLYQSLLLLVVWTHGCIGLHFWLSTQRWWQDNLPVLTGVGVLVPGFALTGYLAEGRRIRAELVDPGRQSELFALWNWPSFETFGTMIGLATMIWWVIGILMILAGAAYVVRKIVLGRRSVRIRYVDGPEITAPKGVTLLEMSRLHGVTHTALCGGRGRCTTCRVIVEEGGEQLHPASAAETRSLRAVNAPPNARLACQIRPCDPLTVFRVFQPDGKRGRAHASQGQERRLAVLFLDIRGFTARTTGQLPYDVVFLLNRFFDAVVPAILAQGGTVDKYLGDGFLALFETRDAASSARAALGAVQGIGDALVRFNETMVSEGAPPVAIGIGLHLGDVVLGEIGAAEHAPRTLIGDTVNTASRLEGQTKTLEVELLISRDVLQAAGHDPDQMDLQVLELRGVAEPLPALALIHSADLEATLAAPRTAQATSPAQQDEISETVAD